MGTIADKLNLLLNTKSAIKNAIIAKGQAVADTDPFSAYPNKIAAIQTGVTLPTLTNPGTAADLLSGKQLIDGDGNVVDGSMAAVEQATPGISVSSSGLITASATQTAGYVAAGTKSATKQLTTQAAQTITPGTANQTIASGRYLTGTQTIKGDANLVADNIKSGVSIFGVAGTLSGGDVVYEVFSDVTVTTAGQVTVACANNVKAVAFYMIEAYTSGSTTSIDYIIVPRVTADVTISTYGYFRIYVSSTTNPSLRIAGGSTHIVSISGKNVTFGDSSNTRFTEEMLPVGRSTYISICYIPA